MLLLHKLKDIVPLAGRCLKGIRPLFKTGRIQNHCCWWCSCWETLPVCTSHVVTDEWGAAVKRVPPPNSAIKLHRILQVHDDAHGNALKLYIHVNKFMNISQNKMLWAPRCDSVLHTSCSILALARRVFYRAIKLGPLYGSNSKQHYCFHLILMKWFRIFQAGSLYVARGFRRCSFLSVTMKGFGRALWSWLHIAYSNYWILTNV